MPGDWLLISDFEPSPEHGRADNLLRSYNTANGYVHWRQYGMSKLLVMYVMQTLASLAKPSDAANKNNVARTGIRYALARPAMRIAD